MAYISCHMSPLDTCTDVTLYSKENKQSLSFQKYENGSFKIGESTYPESKGCDAVQLIFKECVSKQLVPQLFKHLAERASIYLTTLEDSSTSFKELAFHKEPPEFPFAECNCSAYPRAKRESIAEHMITKISSKFSLTTPLSIMALGGGGLADIFVFINQLHQKGYTKFDLVSVEPRKELRDNVTIINNLFALASEQGAEIDVNATWINTVNSIRSNKKFHIISGVDIDFFPKDPGSSEVINTAMSHLCDDGVAFFSTDNINFERTKNSTMLFAPYPLPESFYDNWEGHVDSVIKRCTTDTITLLYHAPQVLPLYPTVKLVNDFLQKGKKVTILYDNSCSASCIRMIQGLCSISNVTVKNAGPQKLKNTLSEINVCFWEKRAGDGMQLSELFKGISQNTTIFSYEMVSKKSETDLMSHCENVCELVKK